MEGKHHKKRDLILQNDKSSPTLNSFQFVSILENVTLQANTLI